MDSAFKKANNGVTLCYVDSGGPVAFLKRSPLIHDNFLIALLRIDFLGLCVARVVKEVSMQRLITIAIRPLPHGNEWSSRER